MSKNRAIDISIIIGIFLLVISLVIAQKTNVDLFVQKFLFNFDRKSWLVDRNEFYQKMIFYKLPKIFLGIVIVILLGILIVKRAEHRKIFYRKLLLTFIGLALIPLAIGNIKKITNSYCPNQISIYGGNYPYIKIFDKYPQDFKPGKTGKCFPAGHAITGFCLMILFFVFEKKSRRISALIFSITLGWIFGFYQMAKGSHFFSDTLVAMCCCFIAAAVIARVYSVYVDRKNL